LVAQKFMSAWLTFSLTFTRSEGVSIPERAQIKVLAPFMERNGFQDGRGWWVKEPCQGDGFLDM
ncbi:MAG: hypothetical protein ACI4V3_01115, partial [Faecousia sp.]